MQFLMDFYPNKNYEAGFKFVRNLYFEDCLAFHSGGGFTHLFVKIRDKKIIVIHFMDLQIEILDDHNLSLEDFIYSDFWGQ